MILIIPLQPCVSLFEVSSIQNPTPQVESEIFDLSPKLSFVNSRKALKTNRK